MVDTKKAEKAIEMLLEAIGEDSKREGLLETPQRIARMYEELLSGKGEDAFEILQKTFSVSCGEMVIEKGISFSSMCEHHLMPFFGVVHIAYIPDGKVVGLSKLARVVDCFAKRLQLQEKLTFEIAEAVFKGLKAKGVFVIVEAEHTCMTARGVKKVGSKTVTYSVRGEIDDKKREEILRLIKQ